MSMVRLCGGLALAAVLLPVALVRGESAEQAFAKGESLLARGEFSGALTAFETAARSDRSNAEYVRHYAMVRRIMDLRQRLDAEQDPARWEYLARGLHAFYVSERIYPEALALDERIHARLQNAWSAALLAETQLAMSRNAEAAQMLAGLGPDKATPVTQSLLGIALVRQGKKAEAHQIAQAVSLPSDAGAGERYVVARLQAAAGDPGKAVQLLQSCFESVAPSRLDGFKAHAKVCPEFAGVAADDMARVMQTQSKIAESACSGGSSCAGCPMRGKCAQSQGK